MRSELRQLFKNAGLAVLTSTSLPRWPTGGGRGWSARRGFSSAASRRRPRRRAASYLKNRTRHPAKPYGFSFNRIFIRSQATKWGICSRLKNISLNWCLIHLPKFISDYVIRHELMDTRIMNHGERFWVTLRVIYPHTNAAVSWLAANGSHRAGQDSQPVYPQV